jgi:Cu-Zn family superoxide dismutase
MTFALGGCGKKEDSAAKKEPPAKAPAKDEAKAPAKKEEAPPAPTQESASKAAATLESKSGSKVTGTVLFEEKDGAVHVIADISGLEPGSHGFHIHEKGDCSSDDGKSAGGHFNPAGVDHAGPDAAKRHAGDLGNIEADKAGVAKHEAASNLFTLKAGETSVLGRAVVVHAKADDLKSQPSGAAGPRVACGVITAAK